MIVLGGDVGKATGLCLLNCGASRPRYMASLAVEHDLPRVLAARFAEHEVEVIGIETPTQVFAHGRAKDDMGARIGIERNLLVSTRATGMIVCAASLLAPDMPIYEGEAHVVRRAVMGPLPRKREDIDRLVSAMVPRLIDGWPTRSNSHERDAAVAALWAWGVHKKPRALRPMRKP